ncbi:leucine rich repeat protein, putative [Eimeria praecox]|uniref:Leucine rich repeat protein, putative n=1 Tax=Eimeria praecox TaxID=51316 RepID=U6G0V3_9EIME|nr:leucine rich repeat protein, putative [Eimeria praecox]
MNRNFKSPHRRPGAPFCIRGVFSGALGNHLGVSISSRPRQSDWPGGSHVSRTAAGVLAVGCNAGQPQDGSSTITSGSSSSGRGSCSSNAPFASSITETAARSSTSTSLGPRVLLDRRGRRAAQRQASQPAVVSSLGSFNSKQQLMGIPEDPSPRSPSIISSRASGVISQQLQRSRSNIAEGSQAVSGPQSNEEAPKCSVTQDSPQQSNRACFRGSPASLWRQELGGGDPAITAVSEKPLEGLTLELVAVRAAPANAALQAEATATQLLRKTPRSMTEGLEFTGSQPRKHSGEASRRPLWRGETKQDETRHASGIFCAQAEAYTMGEHEGPPHDSSVPRQRPSEECFKPQLAAQRLPEASGTNSGSNSSSTSGTSSCCTDISNSSGFIIKVKGDACGNSMASEITRSSSSSKHISGFMVSGTTHKLPVLDRIPDLCALSLVHGEKFTARGESAETGPLSRAARPSAETPVEATMPSPSISETKHDHPDVHGAPDTLELPRGLGASRRQHLLGKEIRRSNSSSPCSSNNASQCRSHNSSSSSCSGSSSNSTSSSKYDGRNGPLHNRPAGICGGTPCYSEIQTCSSRNNHNSVPSNNSSSSCLDGSSSTIASQGPHKLFDGSFSGNRGDDPNGSDPAGSLRVSGAAVDTAASASPRQREDRILGRYHPNASACSVGWRRMQNCKRRGTVRRVPASGVAAVRVLSALGAPGGGSRQDTANDDGAESPVSSPINSDNEVSLRKTSTGPLTRTIEALRGSSSASLTSSEDLSADLSWLYSVTGIRDASEVNLVDTIELIMDRPLGPRTLGALGTFGCLRQLRLVQQQLTSLDFVAACKNLQLLHLPENQIECLEGIQNCKFLEEVDLTGNRIVDLGFFTVPPLAQKGNYPGTLEGALYTTPEGQETQVDPRGPLNALQRLHTLRLNSNRLRSLRGLEGLANLRLLEVADNELTHVGAALSNNKNLEHINVAANQ